MTDLMPKSGIEVGTIFKNYRDMCSCFGIAVLGGNAKKIQLREIGRWYRLERYGGNKLIVSEVYQHQKAKMNSGHIGLLRQDVEHLLALRFCSVLYKSCNKNTMPTISALPSDMQTLVGIVGDAFSGFSPNRSDGSERLFFKLFYDIAASRTTGILKGMQKDGLLQLDRCYYFYCRSSDSLDASVFPATAEEDAELKQVQYAILHTLGKRNTHEVVISGKMKLYYNMFDHAVADTMPNRKGMRANLFDVIQATPMLFDKYGLPDGRSEAEIAEEADALADKINRQFVEMFKQSKSVRKYAEGEQKDLELYNGLIALADRYGYNS